jgi:hypothetical protein
MSIRPLSEGMAPPDQDLARAERWGQNFLADSFSFAMVDALKPRSLPLSRSPEAPSKRALTSHFEVVELTPDGWDALDRQIRGSGQQNAAPWLRCISLLHGLGAVTCVIEHHYVCLDHRSELASFNSQLDANIGNAAARLHFFARKISRRQVLALSNSIKDSYLGYIVCRDTGGPVVGRTVLKVPSEYVSTSTAIDEPVNFFGQRLWVRGVPFMQQDARYAVCAQIAIWSAHYSIFRRGITARKLVSDIVSACQRTVSMYPSIPFGLYPPDVINALAQLGLGTFNYTIDFDEVGSELTEIVTSAESLHVPKDEIAELQGLLDHLRRNDYDNDKEVNFEDNPSVFTVQLIRKMMAGNIRKEIAEYSTLIGDQQKNKYYYDGQIERLIDHTVASLVEPFLRSKLPIYCVTDQHALVLCGISHDEHGPIFFFHDDQFGPYLGTRTAIAASRSEFQRQSYSRDEDFLQFSKFNHIEDRAHPRSLPLRNTDHSEDKVRAVRSIIVPRPPRLLLTPNGAMVAARRVYSEAAENMAGFKPIDELVLRSSIRMGIDYKAMRRRQSVNHSAAVRVFSTVHLAEWIVLIECIDTDGRVTWELAFDGTSGDENPLMQLVRVGNHVRVVHPKSFPQMETCEIEVSSYPYEEPKIGVAKVAEARAD